MNTEAIIKQLKKALACKDDKELRLRVEVIVDLLEETNVVRTPMSAPQAPTPVSVPQLPTIPNGNYTVSGQKGNSVKGAGAISSANTEQINYSRPAGT